MSVLQSALAVLVFLGAYLLIIFERVERTAAAGALDCASASWNLPFARFPLMAGSIAVAQVYLFWRYF